MAVKSRTRRASSSKACYISKPRNKSKPISTSECLPLPALDVLTSMKKFKYGETVKTMYNDVLVHLSRFFDMPHHRKKEARDKSKPKFSHDVHARRNYKDDDKSKPRLSNAGDNKSKPSFRYRCYPFSKINKCHCEDGNKIIMPAAALDAVVSMRSSEHPVAFKIINPLLRKFSHCGVLEFSGEEDNVYLPDWMMNSLLLQQGQVVNIEYAALSKATFLKIQPHSAKFIKKLSNPKEAMERILKDFACVTTGDTIMVNHENKSYYINIVETRPKKVVSLIETDCELEFTKTPDHKEPEKLKPEIEQFKDVTSLEKDAVFKPFTGTSRILNEDENKLVVSLRKYSKKPIRGCDGNCSAGRNRGNRRRQREGKRQH